MRQPNRRRFLAITACALTVPGNSGRAEAATAIWRGVALGAQCSIRLVGVSQADASPVFAAVEAELVRLEGIFSLYRPDSEVVRLNVSGQINDPSPDFLAVLSLCDQLNRASSGAFDPTVQPYFTSIARAVSSGRSADHREIAAASALVGWDTVTFDTSSVRLNRGGAAITLNGIAQGYVTDRVADVMRAHNLGNVLIDMGEISALGHTVDQAPWAVGVQSPTGQVVKRVTLSDRALATSAPMGTILDPDRRTGHIFRPDTGEVPAAVSLVSVSATRADIADGLSTALCVASITEHRKIVARFPGARVELLS